MKGAWVRLYKNQKVDYILLLFLMSNVLHITQVKILYFVEPHSLMILTFECPIIYVLPR